jgi:ribosomal protein S18 acetylase RimI-like enzyme
MNIRPPSPAESGRIAELMKACYPARLQPYLPMTQRGAAEFLRAHFLRPQCSPERVPYVWVEDGVVLAYADFRLAGQGTEAATETGTEATAFLSYLCVDERVRGRGIATALIKRLMRERAPSSLALDVFADNEPALALYKKLGFEVTRSTDWLTRAVTDQAVTDQAVTDQGLSPAPLTLPPLTLRNLPVSDACFAQYGFCELETARARQPVRVGRIGPSKLRVPDLETFRDDVFLACARRTFASIDEALCLTSSDSHRESNAHLLAKSVRLTAQSDQLHD